MTKRNQSEFHAERIALQGELTIYKAEAVKTLILSRLQSDADFELDLHEVTEIDSAGIQILMAAKVEARKRGGNIQLVGHSRPVLDAFELLNLSAFFGDPVLLAGADADRSSYERRI